MKPRLIFAVLLMGFTSLIMQVLLIREFMVTFYGNELTIGLILGNWIILGAFGSGFFSRIAQKTKSPLTYYTILQFLIAISIPLSIYLIRSGKSLLTFTIGEGLGIIPAIVFSFIIITPLGLLNGSLFPLGCRLWSDNIKNSKESTGTVYVIESIGLILAGPIVTYLFISYLNAFQIALLLSFLNFISALLLIEKEQISFFRKIIVCFLSTGLCAIVIILNPKFSDAIHKYSLKKQWQGYTLLESKNSVYGNLAVTKDDEQYTFFSDGIPIITSPVPDATACEEFIHFGMLSHPSPKNVLIIGGGAGGPIAEILKYPAKIDYIELDPLLIKTIKKYPSPLTLKELDNEKVSINFLDGGRYVKTTDRHFDIVFVNLPFPVTLQLNRFYTEDFFRQVKNIFKNKQGVLALRLPGSLSQLNTQQQKLNLSILNTLKDTFPFVKVIPGDGNNIYLSSETEFNILPEIFTERLKERNVSTKMLNPSYLAYRLNPSWTVWFDESLSHSPKVKNNTALSPIGLFYALDYWNIMFYPSLNRIFKIVEKINIKFLISIFFLITIILFSISKLTAGFEKLNILYAISTTGLTGMAFELIFIFIYQSFYGFVYQHIALLISAYMSGLCFGGWIINRNLLRIKNKSSVFILIETGMITFSLTILPVLIYTGKSGQNLSFVFFILAAIAGFFTGAEFPLANSLYQNGGASQSSGIIYAFDLAGSWVGALILSTVLVPVLGLIQTCILIAVIKLSSLILFASSKHQE